MKKFTAAVTALHEAETSAKSELQKSYTEYFSAKLNKFGAKSPADLTPEQKSEFFSEISKDWERGVGAKPAGKKDVEEHGVKESEVNEAKDIENVAVDSTYVIVDGELNFVKNKYEYEPNDSKKPLVSGIDNIIKAGYLKADVKKELPVKESEEVNEAKEIKSDSEFKEYAQTVLKKAFADKYDEEKAMKTAEGILKKADGDYGAAVGMLTSSLGESKDVNEAECSMCGKKECECYKEKGANESANPLNESEVFITDDKFKDVAALKADIAKNLAPAFNKLLKDNGINFPTVTVKETSSRYEFESKPVTGKDLGIMQYGFKEVYINSFGGGALPKVGKDADSFTFFPYIWFNLHYSYTHGSADVPSQGSNGCSLFLPGERQSNVYYDIVEGKFLKQSEADRKF